MFLGGQGAIENPNLLWIRGWITHGIPLLARQIWGLIVLGSGEGNFTSWHVSNITRICRVWMSGSQCLAVATDVTMRCDSIGCCALLSPQCVLSAHGSQRAAFLCTCGAHGSTHMDRNHIVLDAVEPTGGLRTEGSVLDWHCLSWFNCSARRRACDWSRFLALQTGARRAACAG